MSKTLKRSVTLFCACALICTFAVAAFAADYTHNNYTIVTTANGEGPDVAMGGNPKEYVNIAVSCPNNGAVADLTLWKDGWSDTYYGRDQTITVGNGRRAWWYGGDAGNYHISMRVAGNAGSTMTATGTFRNFAG